MTQEKSNSLKPKKLIIIISVAALLLAVANIVASNAVATTGKKLQTLEEQARLLENQNTRLQKLISEKKSLQTISSRAEELGLAPISQTLDLKTPAPLARLSP